MSVQLEASWLALLQEEFDQPYMQELRAFLAAEKAAGKLIYPKGSEWFAALNTTPFPAVKVVILGQDPYHGPNQAHGMCFSVKPGVPPPPSLQNIFKELHDDLSVPIAQHGYLMHWAQQGVLLLNTVLTVEAGRAASHRGRGWEKFTDRIIGHLNAEHDSLVFLLWGSDAQAKSAMIDRGKHAVLRAPHPSPLSAHRGFFGCRHFSQANALLQKWGKEPVDWLLPPP